MLNNCYQNFVKASAFTDLETESKASIPRLTLSGEQAKKIYWEEVKDAKNPTSSTTPKPSTRKHKKVEHFTNKELFLSVQNNDLNVLRSILDACPSSVNVVDEFGWSLLMIACQANSVDAVKELLKRGVDTSVRDRGGNSATNMVIKNKNLEIADLLINNKSSAPETSYVKKAPRITKTKKVKTKLKEYYMCESCNKDFPDKEEHMASTIHNINASKGMKIPPNYKIPQTNRGYQIMLKVGWDREHGLGKDGSGQKYPIKTVQKTDKKGLGLDRKKEKNCSRDVEPCKNIKSARESRRNEKIMERNFRREFY